MPPRRARASEIAAACLLFTVLGTGPAAAQASAPARAPSRDFLVRLEQRLAEQLAAVEQRAAEADAAYRELRDCRPSREAASGAQASAVSSSERVAALRLDSFVLSRLEVHLRRRFASALDRHLLLKATRGELEGALARRRQLPRPARGPHALRDPLAERMAELVEDLRARCEAARQTAEDEERGLDAFVLEKDRVEKELLEAEGIRAAEAASAAQAHERARTALVSQRQSLHARWKALLDDQAALTATRAGPAARLQRALSPPAEAAGACSEPAPLAEVIDNARARAALHTAIEARRELAAIAAREREHLESVAAFHRDWARYLEACRAQAIELANLPGLDTEQCLEASAEARLAARERAEEPARLARDDARTREVIDLLASQAAALRRKCLSPPDLGGLLPAPGPDRRRAVPDLPPNAPAALAEPHAAVLAAEATRRAGRAALDAERHTARQLLETALDEAEALAGRPLEDPSAPAREQAISQARTALLEARQRYLAGLERDHEAALAVEARRAALARLIARQEAPPPDDLAHRLRREWLPRLRAQTARLPATEPLIAVAAGLLALGLAASRVRRAPLLARPLQLLCLAGTLGLLATGLLRNGPAAHALAGIGGAGVLALAWSVPFDLFGGLRLRLGGRARPGELVWNDVIRGRVVRRGWLDSVVDVGEPGRPVAVRIGNRRLVRSRPPESAAAHAAAAPRPFPSSSPPSSSSSAAAAAAAPRAPALLEFSLSLDSDWMAVRQLVQRIGRRHDRAARVHFRVDGHRIRLGLAVAPSVDAATLREEVRRALLAAPFAGGLDGDGPPGGRRPQAGG
ncbi:MAG: hypothetical protein JXQ29_16975 [Planctomycetes bacterium]|nr:hypothetical protein [Planctomycetota bacterium]